jgi:hypothetical protein
VHPVWHSTGISLFALSAQALLTTGASRMMKSTVCNVVLMDARILFSFVVGAKDMCRCRFAIR